MQNPKFKIVEGQSLIKVDKPITYTPFLSLQFRVKNVVLENERHVKNVYTLIQEYGGFMAPLLLIAAFLNSRLGTDGGSLLNQKLVRSMYVAQGPTPFEKRKLLKKDYTIQKIIKRGKERVKAELNIHYLIDRVAKLESAMTVVLDEIMVKNPEMHQELLPKIGKLWLHR